ncbi:MAG TPA: cellulose biosynthesis protein BcsG [Usitatibacter sp.]|nr:cellulose biosynthesis protein BcsG [Usitatibacter sp.]
MEALTAFSMKRVADRLGAWNFYFIAKLVLLALGLLGFHLLENLVFAAALVVMAPSRWRRFRPWIGIPVAIALLYYDSRLPGITRVISQAGLVSAFSADYLAELAGRFVSWKVLSILAIVLGVSVAIARFVRIDVVVVAAMVAMSLWLAPARPALDAPTAAAGSAKATAARNPDTVVADFFRDEAQRTVAFAASPGTAPPFDVIFLHVCSLSWDDLKATGMDKHPLLASFDIVLRRFNSVSTYSGPAAIRFLRAPCGQPAHAALYKPAGPQCLLMPALQQAGLEPQLALNHDGHFDNFLSFVRAQGMQATPVSLKGIAAPQRAFDDSRIYDDAAVLARWLEGRQNSSAPRAAVYYNTLSLHDGNILVNDPKTKSSETYRLRLGRLLDHLQGFIDKLGASGRRAVVVLIPEHGAAWRGDAAQIAGLREIPTPAITLVPVGIRVIGPDARRVGEAAQSSEPTSFLGLSHVVSAMLAKPPFGAAGFRAADYLAGLPTTPFVSEGEAAMVIGRGEGFVIREGQEPWKELR